MSALSNDIVSAAGFGYRVVWHERAYLMRLAAIPLIIMIVMHLVVLALGIQGQVFRQGLVLLPAFMAEGWLIAQFLRTLLLGERWPQQLPEGGIKQNLDALILRARGILSAIIIFVLTKMVINVFTGGVMEMNDRVSEEQLAQSNDNPLMFIPALGLVFLTIWCFRYMWLYIPASILMHPVDFLKRLGGFMSSVKLLGLSLICMVPMMLATTMLLSVLLGAAGVEQGNIGFGVRAVMIGTMIVAELVIDCISTAAVVYLVRPLLPIKPLKDELV